MRILHVAEAFGGGLMDVVCTVAEGSRGAGHDVAIAFGRRPETPLRVGDSVSPEIELFPLRWGARKPSEELRVARELGTLMRRWRPDLLHLHSSVAGVLGTILAPKDIPVIYSPHSFESALPGSGGIRRHTVRALERWTLRRATVVGAVSPSEADLSLRLGGRDVRIVENGIAELNPGRALRRALPDRPNVIACGRTVPQRRPEACARILSEVRDIAEVGWVGGGGGTRGAPGHAALAAASIPTTGWIPRSESLRRLTEATVYLHWTAWDGQPLSVLEALACDAVVIGSDIPPNRHILGEEQVFADEDAAVAAIRRAVLDRDYAEGLRRSQRARRDRWSGARMVREWTDLYGSVVAKV